MQLGEDVIDEVKVMLGGKLGVLEGHIVLPHFGIENADLQLQLPQHRLVLYPQHVLIPGPDQLPAEVFESE
jgi:hypothetical protein